MRCLVTGAGGFIGSHLCEQLLKDGHEVVAFGYFDEKSLRLLSSYSVFGKIEVVHGDICSCANDIYFSGIDWVFHAAARVITLESIVNPEIYYDTNVSGSFKVFETARRNGVKKIVYLASGSCYGNPISVPTPETESIKPEHPYALTKYLGEQCMLEFGRIYNISVVSIRLYYVYGPGTRDGNVFSIFMRQKIENKSLTIIGDGEQRIDFIFVSDAVRAIIMAAESDLCNEIINVGSGESHTINELAKLLGGDIKYISRGISEHPDRVQADISKIRRLLGWEPKVSFEDGVKIVLENIDDWK